VFALEFILIVVIYIYITKIKIYMVLFYYLYYFSFPKLFMELVSVLFARYLIADNLQQESYELLGMIIFVALGFIKNCPLWVVFACRSSNV